MTPSHTDHHSTDLNLKGGAAPHSTSRLAFWAAVLVCVLFFASCLIVSRGRGLWYDEIFTLQFAKLASPAAIWNAMLGAIDTMTPFSHWLAYFGYHLVGPTPLGLRFPSAVAVTLGIFIVYDCARRFTGNFAGMLSIAFLLCSFLPFYGTEARGYSFYYFFSACALWSWLCLKPNSPVAVVGIGLSFFFGLLAHYYFVLCVTPYLVYAVFNWRSGRRSFRNCLAIAFGCVLALSVLWPQAQAVRTFSHNFWAVASFSLLQSSYSEFVPQLAFYLAASLLFLSLLSRFDHASKSSHSISPMRDPERLGWLFLLIPIAGYVLAKTITHAFYNRYLIGMLPGIAFAFACLVGRSFASRPRIIAAILTLMFGVSAWNQIPYIRKPERLDPGAWYAFIKPLIAMEPMFERDGKRYFLYSDIIHYLEAYHYSQRPNAETLFVGLDQTPDSDPNRLAIFHLGRIAPLQFWRMNDVRQHASELVLLYPAPSLIEQLQSEGYRIVVRATYPRIAYYIDKP